MFGPVPLRLACRVAAIALSASGTYFNGRADGESVITAQVAAEHAVAVKLADRVAAAQQGRTDAAASAEANRRAYLDALASRGRDTVKEFYRANPTADRDCLTADRVRSIATDDAAAAADPSAASGRFQRRQRPG